jgi:hypothetical protein
LTFPGLDDSYNTTATLTYVVKIHSDGAAALYYSDAGAVQYIEVEELMA